MYSALKQEREPMSPIANCVVALLCVAFVPLVAAQGTPQAAPKHHDELVSETECRMLIHLGNDGLAWFHGKPDYSRSGDVWLHCPDHAIPLTQTGDVFSFALFPDASRIAVVRHLKRDGSSDAPALLDEIDLGTGRVLEREHLPPRLYGYQVASTCGTVLLFGYHMERSNNGAPVPPLQTEVRDLTTGKQVEASNFNSIRCTADKSVVLRKIGAPWVAMGSLYLGQAGDNVLAPDHVSYFDVSNNGKYLVVALGSRVCMYQPSSGKEPVCADNYWNKGELSVSDSGETWLTGDSLDACPGVKNPGLDTWTCDAIFVWNANQGAPHLVAYGYVDPFGVPSAIGARIVTQAKGWRTKPQD
jgi:hypothetical protein